MKKSENKVRAILDASSPEIVTQVKALAGMINDYDRFLPNIFISMKPVYELLAKNKQFNWSLNCQRAFDKVKNLVVSDKVLVHFNQDLPIVLKTDRMTAYLDVYRIYEGW